MNRLTTLFLVHLSLTLLGCGNPTDSDAPAKQSGFPENIEFASNEERTRFSYSFNQCEKAGVIDIYATDNPIINGAMNRWVATGVTSQCAYLKEFDIEGVQYSLLSLYYGELSDCAAGCFATGHLCAFGTGTDFRLVDASWYRPENKPVGVSEFCSVIDSGDDLAQNCPAVYENQLDAFYSENVQNFVEQAEQGNTSVDKPFQACFL